MDNDLGRCRGLNLYMGCIHHRRTITVSGRGFNVLEYDMGDFLKPTVQLYLEEFPSTAKLPEESSLPNKRAMSPCMPESHSDAEAAKLPWSIVGVTLRTGTWRATVIVGVTPRRQARTSGAFTRPLHGP